MMEWRNYCFKFKLEQIIKCRVSFEPVKNLFFKLTRKRCDGNDVVFYFNFIFLYGQCGIQVYSRTVPYHFSL